MNCRHRRIAAMGLKRHVTLILRRIPVAITRKIGQASGAISPKAQRREGH
jgi:hypothetical protein